MKYYDMTIAGQMILQKVDTLPEWNSSYEGRFVYHNGEDKLYFGSATAWEEVASGVNPTPKRKLLTQNEFRSMFTFEELVAITTESKTDAGVEVFVSSLNILTEFDLNDPNRISELDYLVSKELITQSKEDQILEGI